MKLVKIAVLAAVGAIALPAVALIVHAGFHCAPELQGRSRRLGEQRRARHPGHAQARDVRRLRRSGDD